ncbi:MAG: hypothetical protein BroJett040_06970 [Oligoflexia bacterium]|nr:MAG: hypothetical protein BroJett040_06970 [Oligoflexia bacterium]
MIAATVLMCHAPIVIPEIGQENAEACRKTTQAMQEAADFIVKENPDCLIVLSPHTPRYPEGFGFIQTEKLTGDFSRFGYPEISSQFTQDAKVLQAIASQAHKMNLTFRAQRPQDLDHGAMVPLTFLQRAGWAGNTVVISLPYEGDHKTLKDFGRSLRQASEDLNQKWVILASGDMSHRLIQGAPAGFHPGGVKFDQAVVGHLQSGNYQDLVLLPDSLRDQAAEDVVDTVEIAVASLDFQNKGHRFISYEGPFGVGYSVAILQKP